MCPKLGNLSAVDNEAGLSRDPRRVPHLSGSSGAYTNSLGPSITMEFDFMFSKYVFIVNTASRAPVL
jgi:hypothetical protein